MESDREKYRRNLILDRDLASRVMEWNEGQGSELYSFASSAMNDYVSQSMIERAIDELSRLERRADRKGKKEIRELVGELQSVLFSPYEHSTKAASGDDDDSGYDDRGLGMIENPSSRARELAKRLANP